MNQKVDWQFSTNIYEVNIRQYTPEGTFSAFAKHLPRLLDMGVKTLWLMPITPISQKEMKGSMGSYYACSDYTSINPEFGNLSDFKNLVNEAHSLGFKIIIDWVANHTGWQHTWTDAHPEYYLQDSETGTFKRASGMDDIIELDYSNKNMRQAMIDAMRYWVSECNIDGFRCDLAAWVQLDFWQEARPQLDALKPLFWLGEFDELDNPDYATVFDASYSWLWMHKTEEFYEHQHHLPFLDGLLHQYQQIGTRSMRAWFTSNHDENSWNGTEYDKYGQMALPLAVFSATWNGVPLIYCGQELPNHKRLEFFEKDIIEWTGNNQLHDFYKTLFTFRNRNEALISGEGETLPLRVNSSEGHHVLIFLRKKGADEVLVIINFSGYELPQVDIYGNSILGKFKNIFTHEIVQFVPNMRLQLKPWEYLVFEK